MKHGEQACLFGKNEGCIRKPLTDGPEIDDIFLITAEDQLDISNNVAARVAHIARVKLAELLKVIEFKDGVCRVFLEIHRREHIQMVFDKPLPEFTVIDSDLSVCFRQFQELSGKILRPEGMPQQHQAAVFGFFHSDDAPLGIDMGVHLVLLFAGAEPSIKGAILIPMKRILNKIAVADADIAVVQMISGYEKTLNVVFCVVSRVEKKSYALFFFQEGKHTFFIAENDRYIPDPRFLKLPDLSFDQSFAADLI